MVSVAVAAAVWYSNSDCLQWAISDVATTFAAANSIAVVHAAVCFVVVVADVAAVALAVAVLIPFVFCSCVDFGLNPSKPPWHMIDLSILCGVIAVQFVARFSQWLLRICLIIERKFVSHLAGLLCCFSLTHIH